MLQQILIYNGKVGNNINIGYKEFNNDSARIAFSKVIIYKGAELEIIKVTNQFIEYKIYSNFNMR